MTAYDARVEQDACVLGCVMQSSLVSAGPRTQHAMHHDLSRDLSRDLTRELTRELTRDMSRDLPHHHEGKHRKQRLLIPSQPVPPMMQVNTER